MGKYKSIAFIGLAIIIALIASIVTYNWLQRKAREGEAVSLKTHPVAVAVTDLPIGTVLTREMVKTVPFLKGSLSSGYFSDPSALEKRVLISPVKSGEPILESRLAPVSITTGGVAAAISPKKRAMAVKVDKVIGVSGFVYPGNRVDVLVTLTTMGGRTSAPITKIVLENIPVLAVGAKIEQKGKQDKPSEVDVITLEVTPEEGEKLALAATEGRILLALRNPIDTESVFTRGTTIPQLLSASNTSATKASASRRSVRSTSHEVSHEVVPQKKSIYSVELIKGINVSEVKFEREM